MDKLTTLRDKIDKIDEEILLLLRERAEISKTIGKIKREQGTPIRDPQREEEKYRQIRDKALELGLNPKEIKDIYQKIIEMSIRTQEQT